MDRFQACVKHFLLIIVWLKADQSVCTSCDIVCVSSDEKGISLRPSLESSYLLDVIVRNDPRHKEFLQFCGFLSSVNCVSSRTISPERTYQQPQCGSGARLLRGKNGRSCREQGPA